MTSNTKATKSDIKELMKRTSSKFSWKQGDIKKANKSAEKSGKKGR